MGDPELEGGQGCCPISLSSRSLPRRLGVVGNRDTCLHGRCTFPAAAATRARRRRRLLQRPIYSHMAVKHP